MRPSTRFSSPTASTFVDVGEVQDRPPAPGRRRGHSGRPIRPTPRSLHFSTGETAKSLASGPLSCNRSRPPFRTLRRSSSRAEESNAISAVVLAENLRVGGARSRRCLLRRWRQRPAPSNPQPAGRARRHRVGPPARIARPNLPRSIRDAEARRDNEIIAGLVERHHLGLFDLWSATGPPWRDKSAVGWSTERPWLPRVGRPPPS